MTTLNRVKYISEDFSTYRSEAEEFFRLNYPDSFNNLLATDLGNALMDQLAFAMQALSFQVNRKASELYLDTARLSSSITKLARMLGYTISPAGPSTCDLTVTLSPQPFDIQIPVGFQFNATGDLVYEYRGDAAFVIQAGQGSATLPVREGRSKRVVFISDGSENQQFSIFGIPSDHFIYSDGFVVTVDGVEWAAKDTISFEATRQFEVLFTDEPPKLKFGDGVAGLIPPAGSQIVVKFAYGRGLQGAIGSNQITSSVPLVVNGQSITLGFSNTVANAGHDPENMRSVRSFASTFFRAQNAAVVKEDYDAIAKKVNGVVLADAQTVRGIDADIALTNALNGIGSMADVISSTLQAKRDSLSALADSASSLVNGSVTTADQKTALLQSAAGVVSRLGVASSGLQTASQDLAALNLSTQLSRLTSFVTGLSASTTGRDQAITDLTALASQNTSIAAAVGKLDTAVSTVQQASADISSLSASISQQVLTELGKAAILDAIGQVRSGITGIPSAPGSALATLLALRTALTDYLGYMLSDTSKANHVQVTVLSVNQGNRYVAPSSATIAEVEARLRAVCDAAVTVSVVDGSPRIVPVDLTVEIGIAQNAIKTDVETKSIQALVSSVSPFGLLIRRPAGKSLYRSEIQDAIKAANSAGDVSFVNVFITGPSNQLDSAGNLIVLPQQIIQDGNVVVRVNKRVIGNEEKVI